MTSHFKLYSVIAIIVIVLITFLSIYFLSDTKAYPLESQPKVSTNVEMYDAEGNPITVYEMSEEEYQKTDFREKK